MKIIFALALVSMIFTTPAFASITDVKVDDHNVLIHDALVYTINGGEISSVTADLDFISLIFQVSVLESEAEMSITFERSFFETLVSSHNTKSEFFSISIALNVVSRRFPIGVETIYKPFLKSLT